MTETEKLTISAVIPAYNAAKYIARSIDSVLAQTHPVDEIVIVDDGSTDNTAAIIKDYGDKVRYIHQPNAGVSAARNTGIEAATGNWIAFLDADDEWLPEKIKRQVENLN
ncbi:MAG: glycosyltransferase family 2 protein, partial [Planctomycetota bacterium]